MKWLDRYLQSQRFEKTKPFLRKNDYVLDVGSDDGALFERFKNLISGGLGIEAAAQEITEKGSYKVIPGYFPDACPAGLAFDAIVMLAVLEHIPSTSQKNLAERCLKLLRPAGRIIITVPSPRVDYILKYLRMFRMIDGMHLEEHYGFNHDDTPRIFEHPELKLLHRSTFQLGLNNLFVFEKIA